MQKLSAKWAAILVPLLVTCVMTGVIATLSTLLAIGFAPGWLLQVIKAWLSSWAVAFPLLTVILPATRRVVGRFVDMPKG